MNSNIIAVLDLGSTKVVCLIAIIDSQGNVKIAGIGHQVSKGIKAGIIIDVKKAENAILAAVSSAEKMAGETIDRIIVNVSGTSLTSHNIIAETNISGQEITEKDINHIIAQGKKHFDTGDYEILHCIPTSYTIDDTSGIRDPIGMYGDKLSTELNIVTCSTTAIRNIVNCLARCHLDVMEFIASPYASAVSCLTEDEKNVGSTLIDIGGGCTSISVFSGGSFVFTNSFALGGDHITRDIALGLSTSTTHAERIKTLYGSAISTNSDQYESIEIPFLENEGVEDIHYEEMPETTNISKSKLTLIIRPRLEEILEIAKNNIESSSLGSVVGTRVILTGGTSQLNGIKELASHVLGKQVRIGKPEHIEGLAESTRGVAFSTIIGMLKLSVGRLDGSPKVINLKSLGGSKQFGKVIKWLQQNF